MRAGPTFYFPWQTLSLPKIPVLTSPDLAVRTQPAQTSPQNPQNSHGNENFLFVRGSAPGKCHHSVGCVGRLFLPHSLQAQVMEEDAAEPSGMGIRYGLCLSQGAQPLLWFPKGCLGEVVALTLISFAMIKHPLPCLT